jgi:hypothetical protein
MEHTEQKLRELRVALTLCPVSTGIHGWAQAREQAMIRATSTSVRSLLEALENTAGTIEGDLKRQIIDLLVECWDELTGARDTAMDASKLCRVEELSWDSPILSFKIERHGGTVQGSSRAELHGWQVNLHEATAHCAQGGHRQLKPAAPRLDVRPIAEQICAAVQLGPREECDFKRRDILKWKSADEVRIRHGDLIPDEGPQQTVAGRRRRLRKELKDRMESIGWKLDAVHRSMTFRRRT